MQGTVLTLWVIEASNSKYGQITYVYARDEEHARTRARGWLGDHQHLPEVTFRAFPGGYQIHRSRLPGTIRVQMDEQGEEASV